MRGATRELLGSPPREIADRHDAHHATAVDDRQHGRVLTLSEARGLAAEFDRAALRGGSDEWRAGAARLAALEQDHRRQREHAVA